MAFDTYETAKTIMDNELGVRKTVMLNKVYEELYLSLRVFQATI